MSIATLTGVSLCAIPLASQAVFALPAARFEYADTLRQPTCAVLERFGRRHRSRAGGWSFALIALLLAPLAVATVTGVRLRSSSSSTSSAGRSSFRTWPGSMPSQRRALIATGVALIA